MPATPGLGKRFESSAAAASAGYKSITSFFSSVPKATKPGRPVKSHGRGRPRKPAPTPTVQTESKQKTSAEEVPSTEVSALASAANSAAAGGPLAPTEAAV